MVLLSLMREHGPKNRGEQFQRAESSRISLDRPASLYTQEKLAHHNAFFDRLIDELNLHKVDGDIVAVLHILPDAIPFTRALSKIADINTIIPKPKSINENSLESLSGFNVNQLTRDNVEEVLDGANRKTVFLDIGGYFAPHVDQMQERLGDNFAGVVEDTENGLQRYERRGVEFPFLSVARSPLKDNEDTMVGQAISYSAEAILRQHSVLLNGLKVGVVGFGKIGRSIATDMDQKRGKVSIYDRDNIRLTHAISGGFDVSDREQIISESDVLCLATGNLSLAGEDFGKN